ncbi:MAG: hypothetical protein AUJ92_22325 [Armatimonadetes bacterium CG2_30_59_28]|nr:MAG: hypothetical protein AUJ92_22325 [Armatimonadetes bacterium CG2_30_59_28]PIU60604.1 MAG: hypothetical protein COS85_23595 [Armatimonadetes bacterium CG07_land_8_20_14_0_80_59_28]PIX42834.1 MAG: hypothetical protein COZ56_08445 [Armatimonadetes bacterium CG_4_8_14_3_um_filter_58_9]PIY43545.1 MAG: hypothetical protein COZ05_10720 [Armatimonadetes bacterium CG_4_10_14_3_um_filter_59_10]
MKVYIHTDIEGVAGWVFYGSPSESLWNYHHTQRMNQLLTNEVKAACDAAFDAGADEVWVNDSHGSCYSILFEQLPKQCRIMHGRPGYCDAWLSCFDGSVDALVCIGQHAMAATPHAVCPHSLYHINGGEVYLSETTMAAALTGCHGVPCVCVSGDDKICAEVNEKIPECKTVVVKWGIAAQNAQTLMPEKACELIHNGVCAGIEKRLRIPPYQIPGPYRINISDRNPEVQFFAEDIVGDDFCETVGRAHNSIPYGHFGEDPLDDRSFRWPG